MAVVDLLEGIAPHIRARHLADEEDERHAVLLGGMHRDGRIAGARAAAHGDHPRPAGKARIGERHTHDASSGVLPEETALEWCQQWLALVRERLAQTA